MTVNFTERTGRDHWEVLLRARAIENGAYVLAPAQIGGPRGQPAYGRSMVIDPWGTVIAQGPDRVGIARAELDLDQVSAVRRQIPVLANRRPEACGSGSSLSGSCGRVSLLVVMTERLASLLDALGDGVDRHVVGRPVGSRS